MGRNFTSLSHASSISSGLGLGFVLSWRTPTQNFFWGGNDWLRCTFCMTSTRSIRCATTPSVCSLCTFCGVEKQAWRKCLCSTSFVRTFETFPKSVPASCPPPPSSSPLLPLPSQKRRSKGSSGSIIEGTQGDRPSSGQKLPLSWKPTQKTSARVFWTALIPLPLPQTPTPKRPPLSTLPQPSVPSPQCLFAPSPPSCPLSQAKFSGSTLPLPFLLFGTMTCAPLQPPTPPFVS